MLRQPTWEISHTYSTHIQYTCVYMDKNVYTHTYAQAHTYIHKYNLNLGAPHHFRGTLKWLNEDG